MGYRSEVAYSICFEDENAMGLFITYVFSTNDEHMITALKECEVDFKGLRINFHAWDTKWYDSYDDVKGHTRLYTLPDKEDTQFFEKCDYKFMRVGEEQGDIDDEYSSHSSVDVHDEFYTNTSITLPFASNYTPYGDELKKLEEPQPQEKEA